VLVVDLPPGTGDVQLTLVQKLRIDGVVLVTTPQEIALIDARRAAIMFGKTATPILGLIENMAFFADPSTGAPIPIFGSGGGVAEAKTLGVPVLARCRSRSPSAKAATAVCRWCWASQAARRPRRSSERRRRLWGVVKN
jgi:ATP-binding protein involved in chromosome partitioning